MDISPAPKNVALKILDYHGGQDDPVYALGSSWLAGHSVDAETVEDAVSNLRKDLEASKKDPKKFGWGEKEWKELEYILKAIQKQVDKQSEGGSGMRDEILSGMARSLWAFAWSSAMESEGHGGELRGEITDMMPMVPKSVDDEAEKLAKEIESKNDIDLNNFNPLGVDLASNSKLASEFGWYLAAEMMGQGVRWSDDYEDHGLKLPRIDDYMDEAYLAVQQEYGDSNKQEESVKTGDKNLIKEGVNNQTWDKYERLAELMGKDEVCDELMRAMSDKEANENLDWIIQMHDLSSEFKGMDGYEDDEDSEDEEESVKATASDLIEAVMRGKNPKAMVE